MCLVFAARYAATLAQWALAGYLPLRLESVSIMTVLLVEKSRVWRGDLKQLGGAKRAVPINRRILLQRGDISLLSCSEPEGEYMYNVVDFITWQPSYHCLLCLGRCPWTPSDARKTPLFYIIDLGRYSSNAEIQH